MTPDQIKHLEFIQAVITRMNANSFQIKGWMITIVSALLALYASSEANTTYIFVAIMPTVLFWFMDAYYLQQERKFRAVYDDVILENSTIKLFEMPITNYNGCEYCFCAVFFSKTIFALYGTIIILLLFGGFVLKYKICIKILN